MSDEICEAHGLSVIKDPKERGRSFYEWQMVKKGISYKKRLKDNIDTVIPLVDSYDGFLAKMKDLGYEIKQGKYDSFRMTEQERFTRSKTLGVEYTKEAIEHRILDAKEHPYSSSVTHPAYFRVWKYNQELGLIENTHSSLSSLLLQNHLLPLPSSDPLNHLHIANQRHLLVSLQIVDQPDL